MLADRRDRIARARRFAGDAEHQILIDEIDAARDRLERGAFGVCGVCHDPIGADRLSRDPLARSCAAHPSDTERARLQADLALARQVQLGLLPRADVSIPGWQYAYWYEAASDGGGDFCDVIPVAARRETLIVVGGVAGCGVAASMLMSTLLATFRSLAWLGLPAGELLARVNDLFHDSAPPPASATLAAAVLRPGGGVDLYSAGHWPPLRRRGRHIEPLDAGGGLPVGLFASSRYEPTHLELGEDDTLLFFTDGALGFTDGALDVSNPAGDDVGRRRLAAAFAAAPTGRTALPSVVARCLSDVRGSERSAPAAGDAILFAVQPAPAVSRRT
jgi:sigma-B regulation protein RsbU (phosphoserine phosphatase)